MRRVITPAMACLTAALCALVLAAAAPCRAQQRTVAHRPAIDLYVYRRSLSPDEPVKIRVSAFNQSRIDFTIYLLNLPVLVNNPVDMLKLPKSLRDMDLSRLTPVRRWRYAIGKRYTDQWAEREAVSPRLSPGVYLVRASGAGAERRTWLAVTDIALLSRRSRDEVLVYAAQVRSGKPVAGLPLAIVDRSGARRRGVTDSTGVLRVSESGAPSQREANLWIYGETQGSPAFLLAGAAPPPEPNTVYMFTDRPIYRPGHTIQYRGTVRQRLESDAPGGFTYRPFADQPIEIEVRDSTDALLDRHTARTNRFGTFDGSFRLGTEPPLGRWQIIAVVGGRRTYCRTEVQAYRKPEFTAEIQTPLPHIPGGDAAPVVIDARYLFGQPVSGGAVQYQIRFEPSYGRAGQPDQSALEPPYDGQGVLDSRGRLELSVKTKRLGFDRQMIVSATVTDLSRRSQRAEGRVLVTAGLFHLAVAPERSLYHPGEPMRVSVLALDYDDRPVTTRVKVELIENKEDSKHRSYQEKTRRDVVTDAAGKGTVVFPTARPGWLELAAEAFDTSGSRIQAAGSVWITGDDVVGYDYPDLSLVADRPAYRPGETADVLVNTSLVAPPGRTGKARSRVQPQTDPVTPAFPEAWALVTVEGERLYEHRVVRLRSRSSTLKIPLSEKYFPSVRLSVAILQGRHVYEQELRLTVGRDEQKLQVDVRADRARFAPGEPAVYTVSTRDWRGRPVSAEVGLGVVDASIYALRPDDTPDPEGFFYGGQEPRIHIDFSFAAQYSGGAAQTVPHAVTSAPSQPGIRVRRQFADTALWQPSVVTGDDGVARVSFTLPDNLTTWRATARAISLQTAVGKASSETVSSLPLVARLELPRFAVEGDEVVASTVIHNNTGTARTVKAHLDLTGATLQDGADRVLQVPDGGDGRIDWHARIGAIPSDIGVGGVRFTVTANGGPGGQDAAEQSLPVLRDAVEHVESRGVTLSGQSDSEQFDLTALPPGSAVTVTLTPSLAGAALGALDYLISYPYGCAEQTMSALLPDIAVAQALRRVQPGRVANPRLRAAISAGLQKLYRYQHNDGGWNWWEFDQTDGDMTAYVLYGLIAARDAGYLVDEQRILRGTDALLRKLREEPEWGRRADWALTIVYARPQAVTAAPGAGVSILEDLFRNRGRLDTTGLASLALALSKAGGPYRQRALDATRELEAKAVVKGTSVFWPAADGGYTWRGDDAGVTAHALRAVLENDPSSGLIAGALRWLVANRAGPAWQSTRSSAEAVLALSRAMELSGETEPDFEAVLALDGARVVTRKFQKESAFEAAARVTLTPGQLAGHKELRLGKTGRGVLYASIEVRSLIPSEAAHASANGLSITRLFTIFAPNPLLAGTIPSGEDIGVTVHVKADQNYRYAMLEEPIPAGCGVAPPPDEGLQPAGLVFEQGEGYVRQEVRDNRVVFFFSELPKGIATFTYRLHAETPGTFRVLPSIASLVYFPEIRGTAAPVKARIADR